MGYAKLPLGPYVHMNLIGPQQVSKCNRDLLLSSCAEYHTPIHQDFFICYRATQRVFAAKKISGSP